MKMRRFICFRLFVVSYLLWINSFTYGEWSTVTYCALSDDSKFCNEIQSTPSSNIRCVLAIDRMRCLEQLIAGKADFGIFNAEDLYLASLINNASARELVVTNEFRLFENQKYEFDMVVLTSNEVHITSLADLRGKRLCHPGFDETECMLDFSEVFLQYFEEIVVPEQCDPKLSVFENKVKSLNSFFGGSCKPGSWSPEVDIDAKLKSRYSKLCQNCGDPKSCSSKDIYWGKQGALTCMSDCLGDVTWARKQDIDNQFNEASSIQRICHDVSFLCPDGTSQPINSTNPCVWISRPWPVIVARKSATGNISALIDYINRSENTFQIGSWEYKLRALLGHSFQPIHQIEPITTWEYLEEVPGFLHASNLKTCQGTGPDKVIKICTENERAREKCDLMALVAFVYSVDPQFNCSLSEDCLQSVADKKDDVVITSTERLKYVYENQNLKTILYQTTQDYGELRYSSAVVTNQSSVQELADLKGKKACFTKMHGLGWNSLLMVLKENSLISDDCDGTKEILKFFSDVCIIDHEETDEIKGCFENDDFSESFGSLSVDEAQGLRCIVEGGGDVAFIDHNFIGQYLADNANEDWARSLTVDNFRSICPHKNSTPSDCYLTRATFGEVLIHKNTSKDREEEVVSALLILNSLLGNEKRQGVDSQIFKLFTHYHNEKHVLFESTAGRLESAEQYLKRGRLVNKFYEQDLLHMMERCKLKEESKPNNAFSIMISIPVILNFIPLIHIMLHFF